MYAIFIDDDTLLLRRRIIFKGTRCFGCSSIVMFLSHLFGEIFGIVVEGVPCDVQPMGHEEGDRCEQEIHFERGEIGCSLAAEIVKDQMAGTQDEVKDGAEHAALTHAVGFGEVLRRHLHGKAVCVCRLSAARTVIASIMLLTVQAFVFLNGHRGDLARPFPPRPELLDFIFKIEFLFHSCIKSRGE